MAVAWPAAVSPSHVALFGVAGPHPDAPGAAVGAREGNSESSAAPAGDIVATSASLASPVPEPGTLSLILAGLAVMGWLGRRRGS
jgi:hypothetical protein